TVPGGTGTQSLISFDTATPGTVTTIGNITGLVGGAGEAVVGIDIRPSNGMLYAVTNNAGAGRLYTVNTATGLATHVRTTPFPPPGAALGVDFNPVPDLLRITSDTGETLRINPGTAAVAGTDTALAYAATDPANGTAPVVVGSAYTNNFAGATSTKLYDIDAN